MNPWREGAEPGRRGSGFVFLSDLELDLVLLAAKRAAVRHAHQSTTKDPVLVTRRGRLAGVFFPTPDVTLPIELKRELFPILSAEIRRQLRRRRLNERDVDGRYLYSF